MNFDTVAVTVVASAISAFAAGALGVYVAVNLLTWRTAQLEQSVGTLFGTVNSVRERVATLEGRAHN